MTENTFQALLGVACARGRYWAAEVAKRVMPSKVPWPEFKGKMRERALERVSDIGKSANAEQLEALALECWETGQTEWALLAHAERKRKR